MAGELKLIELYESGRDFHKVQASRLFGISEDDVTSHLRAIAKKVNHATNYGQGFASLAEETGLSVEEASEFLQNYYRMYPGVKHWHANVLDTIMEDGSLTTPVGRYRQFFTDVTGKRAKEQAWNYVPQSLVHDILAIGMVRFWRRAPREVLLVADMHDGLLVECPVEMVEEVKELMNECLQVPVYIRGRKLVIPVEVEVGTNWRDLS